MTRDRRGDVVRGADIDMFYIVVEQVQFADQSGREYYALDEPMKIIIDDTVVEEVFGERVATPLPFNDFETEAVSGAMADRLRTKIYLTVTKNADNSLPDWATDPKRVVQLGNITTAKKGFTSQRNAGGSRFRTEVIRTLDFY